MLGSRPLPHLTQTAGFKHKSASLLLTIWDDGAHATLSDLFAKTPRQGHATALLRRVTRLCDRLGLTVVLEVKAGDPESGMDNSRLQQFYNKFGFEVWNPGDDYILMERKPRTERSTDGHSLREDTRTTPSSGKPQPSHVR